MRNTGAVDRSIIILLALSLAVSAVAAIWLPMVGFWGGVFVIALGLVVITAAPDEGWEGAVPTFQQRYRHMNHTVFSLCALVALAGLILVDGAPAISMWLGGATIAIGALVVCIEAVVHVAALRSALRDPDSRLASIDLGSSPETWDRIVELGSAGERKAVAQLVDLLMRKHPADSGWYPEPELRLKAKEALEEIGDAATEELVVHLASAETDYDKGDIWRDGSYRRVLSVLANVNAGGAVAAVAKLLEFPGAYESRLTREVRASAAWCLGELGNPEAAAPLTAALERSEWHIIHRNAIVAIHKLGLVRRPEVAGRLRDVIATAGSRSAVGEAAQGALDDPTGRPDDEPSIYLNDKRKWAFRQ